MTHDEQLLAGGNVGRVWRVGDTVRRETGPWTPAVMRLLGHLAPRLPAVPRHHGTDERGREVLDFLPGLVVDVDREQLSKAQLAAVVAWTRRLHETTRGLDLRGPWRFPSAPGADLIGHNDVAPYNLCFVTGAPDRLAGVFDWDLAGPTTARLELGFLAWNCVPLYRVPPVDDPDAWTASRLRLVATAYGEPGLEARDVLAGALERLAWVAVALVRAADDGDAGMRRLRATGEPERTLRALRGLRDRAGAITAHL
ncbi:phosphotransferase [Nocardioides marinquilinus]|uniref:phosphotransferase n=1 Tax=Nocardioides marinquilinus TaxID=1210400 RepID=UPI0031EE3466